MRKSGAFLLCAVVVLSQPGAAATPLPAGVFAGGADYRAATAGRYAVDPDHTAVLARVSHIGYAYSVFRFGTVGGTLVWDPDKPERASLNIEVRTASIASPVAGFAAKLSGDGFLNSAAFPAATFVSTAFHRIDDHHGRVEGQFTLMGKSQPLTFDAEMVGAGKGFMGHPRIGVHAAARIDPQHYGLPPVFDTPIVLDIDAEFAEQS